MIIGVLSDLHDYPSLAEGESHGIFYYELGKQNSYHKFSPSLDIMYVHQGTFSI